MNIKRIIVVGIMLLGFSVAYSGAFSTGMYGNVEGWYQDQSSSSSPTNADWNITGVTTYFEFRLSGLNLAGFNIWSRLGASVDLNNMNVGDNYDPVIHPNFGGGNYHYGINPDLIDMHITNTNSDIYNKNFQLHQFEAHIDKQFPLFKGKTRLAFYRGEDRTDVGQPYLDFFGGIGDGDTRVGVSWDSYGIAGFYTRGFIVDYRSKYKNVNDSVGDPYAYALGTRVGRNIIKKQFLNLSMGLNFGASQYFRAYGLNNVYGGDSVATNKYFYNVFGMDASLNGDIPVVGSYYLFGAFGRSYAPQAYGYEYRPGIGFLGNTNALIYTVEFKWNKKFSTKDVEFGHLFLGFLVYGRQPHYETYLGGGGDVKYKENVNLRYNFPYKALSLQGYMEYKHDYTDFDEASYHIWQVNKNKLAGTSVEWKKHLDLNVTFKSGFSLNLAWDKEWGNTYLGSFDTNGVTYLTIVTAGEGKIGRISPQLKVVAVEDTNKILISTGIELLLNLSSWMRFYSRFAYVQSAGYWKAGDEVNWWNAFVQFRFSTGNNSSLTLELGDGGGTDSGFVSDRDLINGSIFQKRMHLRFEYWM